MQHENVRSIPSLESLVEKERSSANLTPVLASPSADRLAEVAASFALANTMEDLAVVSETAAAQFIHVQYNGLYLWDFQTERLRLLYARGFTDEEWAEAERSAMERHPGAVFRSGELMNVADTATDAQQRTRSSPRRFEVRSRLFVPVLFREQVLGVYGLASSIPNCFGEQEVGVMRFISRLAGVAYRRLLDQKEREQSEFHARSALENINNSLRSTQRQLMVANDQLEHRVRERTADLDAQNRKLSQTLDELHEAQEQLVQAEKMASLGLLVAGIAHEIKNPLNFVNNFAELTIEYAQEIEELTPVLIQTAAGQQLCEILPELTGNLQAIREHGRRADGIINAMLLHARGRPGEAVTTDLNELLRAHVVLGYQGFRAKDREFRADLTHDLGSGLDAVSVAPQELSQVILNLVSNACYAMRERIRQNCSGYRPQLILSTRREGNSAVIRVRDNGTGIPEEIRRRIFDPFFTTKPPGQGTGLGLSLCHDIVVQQLGGRIEVASERGVSTEFVLTLPVSGHGSSV